MAIASYYARRSDIDDIVSVALLELQEAVTRAATALTDNNIAPYLTVSISRAINKYISENKIITIPAETKRLNGLQDIKVSSIHAKLDIKTTEDAEFSRDAKLEQALAAPDTKGVEKIWERLFEIATNDLECEILILKSQGYTNNEVASLLGKYPSQISKIKSDLERRYFNGE